MTDEIRSFLRENFLGTLATVDSQGRPRTIPIHVMEYEGTLYWFSAEQAVHSLQILVNPNISITIFSPNREDGLKALNYQGKARICSDQQRDQIFGLFQQGIPKTPDRFAEMKLFAADLGELDEAQTYLTCWYFNN